MERLVCLILGYICGLFQTGYIYERLHHIDIRKHGKRRNHKCPSDTPGVEKAE